MSSQKDSNNFFIIPIQTDDIQTCFQDTQSSQTHQHTITERSHSKQANFTGPREINMTSIIYSRAKTMNMEEENRQRFTEEHNFFTNAVRKTVEESNIRTIKGEAFNDLFQKLKTYIPNLSREPAVCRSVRLSLRKNISYRLRRERMLGKRPEPEESRLPTEYLDLDTPLPQDLLTVGTEVCLTDKGFPVAKAKIISYPGSEHGMDKDEQEQFASVQILLKKRNTNVDYLPYQMDMREWSDIGKGSRVGWRIVNILPLDTYDKYMKGIKAEKGRSNRLKKARREQEQLVDKQNGSVLDDGPLSHVSEDDYNEENPFLRDQQNSNASEEKDHDDLQLQLSESEHEEENHLLEPDEPNSNAIEEQNHDELRLRLSQSEHEDDELRLRLSESDHEEENHLLKEDKQNSNAIEEQNHDELRLQLSESEHENDELRLRLSESEHENDELRLQLSKFDHKEENHLSEPNEQRVDLSEKPMDVPDTCYQRLDFVEVALSTQTKRKKNSRKILYFAQIIELNPITVSFLKSTEKSHVKIWPPKDDVSQVELYEITRKLKKPKADRRGYLHFSVDDNIL